MKPPKFDYTRAASLEEALQLLDEGDAQPLSGGQSLVPAMNFRLAAPARLIDLQAIAGLRGIGKTASGDIVAGAMTTHRDFETSALIQQELPMLPHAMEGVAHLAIRTRGTIGGSLAHADPAADWPALCMACDAVITVASVRGERQIPSVEFSLGMFETALQPGEMVTGVRFPRWPSERSLSRKWSVQKVARRRGDFAIVGVILTLDIDDADRVADARVVLQGVSGCPVLAHQTRELLIGHVPTPDRLRDAARAAREAASPGSDLHASAELRTQLMETLTYRALGEALGLQEPAHV